MGFSHEKPLSKCDQGLSSKEIIFQNWSFSRKNGWNFTQSWIISSISDEKVWW